MMQAENTANKNTEQDKKGNAAKPIYFSMNAPDWFTNIPDADKKCKIVENLANELKNEKPISQKQREELISID